MIGRRCAVLLALVLVPAGSALAELSRQEVRRLFDQANEAFRQANSLAGEPDRAARLYDAAILAYERIVNEGGIRNARLYYNLGNAYFLKQDIGRAILNYRRAERLDKGDADLQNNFAFAREKRVDIVPVPTEQRVLKTLFFWHYDFAIKTKFVVALVCFAVLCVSLTGMVWIGRNAASTVTGVVFGMLTACFALSLVVEARQRAGTICGVIVADAVVAHQADWENSPASFKEPLHAGTEFELAESRTGWLHIRLADGSDGWVPDDSAELI
jgi:tetratricopeptide (TPR) repeat protein